MRGGSHDVTHGTHQSVGDYISAVLAKALLKHSTDFHQLRLEDFAGARPEFTFSLTEFPLHGVCRLAQPPLLRLQLRGQHRSFAGETDSGCCGKGRDYRDDAGKCLKLE